MSDLTAQIRAAIETFEMERARELLRDALKQNPSAELYYLASLAALNEQQKVMFLEKALELDPFHAATSAALQPIKRQPPPSVTTQPAPALERRSSRDEIYCYNCGKPISKQAIMCVHCGVATRRNSVQGNKSKTTAVLLAIFLGIWTWVYTWQKDWHKFVIGIVGGIGISSGYVVLMLPSTGNKEFIPICFFLLNLVPWIWAIIDRAAKPSEWYANYPDN